MIGKVVTAQEDPEGLLEAWKVASPETEMDVNSVFTSMSLRAQQVLTYK